jgi:hypothetical protein
MKDQAEKKGDLDLILKCDELIKSMQSHPNEEAWLEELKAKVINKFNERLEHKKQLHKKQSEMSKRGDEVKRMVKKFKKVETVTHPCIHRNLQFGIANVVPPPSHLSQELEKLSTAAQGLSKVRDAINYINSQQISTELFEHLKYSQKQKLTAFVKRPLPELRKSGLVRTVRINYYDMM